MNESDFPHLHAYRSTAHEDGPPQAAPAVDRNTFIANLNRIGSGAAADGQPWPERHQLPGRCLALADADCGLRVAGCAGNAAGGGTHPAERRTRAVRGRPGDEGVGTGLPVVVRAGGGAVAA